jgi:soluble lytic murein transglycosylase-like protein
MKIVLVCLFAAQAFAGEYAILTNGFRVHVDSHEVENGMVRLHDGQGVMEFPASLVSRFEKDDYAAPAPAPKPVAGTAPAQAAVSPKELIDEAAKKAALPPAFVHAVAMAESGYQETAVSPKGAIGLMQLMPGTAAALNADPNDPRQNAEAGAMYLRQLLLKYDYDPVKALAAYNAGPAAVDRYHGVPPYAETESYVNRVIRNYKKLGGD